MRKVYSLQDDYFHIGGLIYPPEIEGTFSICFYIEGNEKGKLDDTYEMAYCLHGGKGSWKGFKKIPLKRVKGNIFEINYKGISIKYRAKKSRDIYTGKLNGPKAPLWMLFVSEKEWSKNCEEACEKHGLVLMGYFERPKI